MTERRRRDLLPKLLFSARRERLKEFAAAYPSDEVLDRAREELSPLVEAFHRWGEKSQRTRDWIIDSDLMHEDWFEWAETDRVDIDAHEIESRHGFILDLLLADLRNDLIAEYVLSHEPANKLTPDELERRVADTLEAINRLGIAALTQRQIVAKLQVDKSYEYRTMGDTALHDLVRRVRARK
jgi:hypothetical protein